MDDHGQEHSVESSVMSLGAHLDELRARLLRCIVVVVLALIAAWCVREHIMRFLVRPHRLAAAAYQLEAALKYRSYLEPLTAQLKACLVAALIATAPFIIYQVWAFITPALFRRERRTAVRIASVSLACFAAGVAFGYFLFIPVALRFLLALSGPDVEPVIMIGAYLPMLFMMTLALGVAFQTPLVIFYLVRWKIVTARAVQQHRKGAIVAAFVLAAVLTPPDPMTQIMMALPLVILYDLGALLASPNRRTVAAFVRFNGIVALLAAIAFGLFYLWPVGWIDSREGAVELRGAMLPTGSAVRLRRGDVCSLGPDAQAVIRFGKDAYARRLLVKGPARLRLRSAGAVSLRRGALYAQTTGGKPIRVSTRAAQAVLADGQAEFLATDTDVLTVNVLAGQVTVRAGGTASTVDSGRTATFQSGGLPLNTDGVQERWRDFSPDDSGPPAAQQPGPTGERRPKR